MSKFRITLAIAFVALSGAALAQAPGGTERGSIPPGEAKDGSRPSEGAITGGSILPGERGGVTEESKATTPSERIRRCNELSGSLREECLLKEESASGGATKAPEPSAPPPQNPR